MSEKEHKNGNYCKNFSSGDWDTDFKSEENNSNNRGSGERRKINDLKLDKPGN